MDIKVNIIEDYRKLVKGETITFSNKLNFVVGSNGSGKSSLLNVIRSQWKGHYMGRLRKDEVEKVATVTGLDSFDSKYDYNTETDSNKGQSFADMDYLLSNGGIHAMRMSSGEAQNQQIYAMFNKIASEKEKKVLIILDEPEKGLDVKRQVELFKFIRLTSKMFDFNYIISTHSVILLELLNGDAFDIETRTWVNSKEYVKGYIDETLTEEPIEKAIKNQNKKNEK